MRTSVKKPSNFEKLQKEVNPSQPSVAFHIETSLLICNTNQMPGSYMKCNTGLRLVKDLSASKYSANLSELINFYPPPSLKSSENLRS